ncbi:sigma-54-dependent transcriptional regulator [Ferruginibacter albus]|uniref:sigma-54-dependent transcriptional regulator n=1 Tax=Ferruginibacter albus TaxID=2875540 RepID=UPI001CC54B29|nr:sigma-54 dependent transcriptional regulator [Ferruginibacter albus]UAY51968.1 sigma-54 dependent transcriptional regulator [Ferruginibacter albus]
MKKRVLIIDDDMDMCMLLERFLTKNGYEVETANSGIKGIEKFKENKFDIVLCDFRLGDKKDGREVLIEIKKIEPQTIVLIITGYSDIKIAVEVIKLGAFDYIAKPLVPDEVLNVLTKAVEKLENGDTGMNEFTGVKARKTKNTGSEEHMVGVATVTTELYRQIEIVAPTNFSVILYGESGTGKEVIAKTIHEKSNRKNNPFVAMDCGTLSKELAGSELFGHMKGAFTGALADKEGHFELANGGTLFLDEVGNLSAEIQASLLRVIQERKFKRIGGLKEMDVDVRIIVASNENLQEAYRKGKFREDLYHRFNEFSINLPPLRKRKEDIPLFAEFFLNKTKDELNKDEVEAFEEDIIKMFIDYSWPGNLREFRNVVRRAVLLTPTGKIQASTLPWEIINSTPLVAEIAETAPITESLIKKDIGLKDAASRAEYDAIMAVLKKVNFNKTKAAEVLNIDRKTLYNKIKSFEELNNENKVD